jgi:hypothetical protein
MHLRNLTENEIVQLESNGCRSDNWSTVMVTDQFRPGQVTNVHFAGRVHIGNLDGRLKSAHGGGCPSSLRNCTLEDVVIGNNAYIADVRYLKSYEIGNEVWIQNVGSLTLSGRSSFGNGVKIDVLNEGGGRELMISEQLSAQLAYMLVLYRHDEPLIQAIEELVGKYVEDKTSERGKIGHHAAILDTNTITNVHIGSHARVEGAQLLREGTVVSRKEAPGLIGEGVIAENFIVHTGSRVNGAALLKNCFIGQSVQIGRQFSAENSVFFTNSEGFHGEACSLFAGPYTVTHHKSTLLIAALVSFFNAGSGTNQSNHMYKLGPVHQGILERGGKTGSFSYLLWPSHVGAFSAVIGKHFTNFDSSDLPFSYITEENGRSILTPAMNLFTVGTRRDSMKWPNRDKRNDPEKLDLIHFDLFNPFIIQKVRNGIRVLRKLAEQSSKKQEFVSYKGIQIKRLLLKTCGKYYDMVIPVFIGQQLQKMIGKHQGDLSACLEEIRHTSVPDSMQWVDICGMIAAVQPLQELLERVKFRGLETLEALQADLFELYESYDNYSAWYAILLLCERLEKKAALISEDDLKTILSECAVNTVKLNNMILKDAMKEYDQNSRIGYGLDGEEAEKADDFLKVRGSYEENSFVKQLLEENRRTQEEAGAYAIKK